MRDEGGDVLLRAKPEPGAGLVLVQVLEEAQQPAGTPVTGRQLETEAAAATEGVVEEGRRLVGGGEEGPELAP